MSFDDYALPALPGPFDTNEIPIDAISHACLTGADPVQEETISGPTVAVAMETLKNVAREAHLLHDLRIFVADGRWCMAYGDSVCWVHFNEETVWLEAADPEEKVSSALSVQVWPCGTRFSVSGRHVVVSDASWEIAPVPGNDRILSIKAYQDDHGMLAIAVLSTSAIWTKVGREGRWEEIEYTARPETSEIALCSDDEDIFLFHSYVGNDGACIIQRTDLIKPEPDAQPNIQLVPNRVKGMAVIGSKLLACFGTSSLLMINMEASTRRSIDLNGFRGLENQIVLSVDSDGVSMFVVVCSDGTACWFDRDMFDLRYTLVPTVYQKVQTALNQCRTMYASSNHYMTDALKDVVGGMLMTPIRMIKRRIVATTQTNAEMSRILSIACKAGNPEVVKYLLESGVQPASFHLAHAIESNRYHYDLAVVASMLGYYYAKWGCGRMCAVGAFDRLIRECAYTETTRFYDVAKTILDRGCFIGEDALLSCCDAGLIPERSLIRKMKARGADINVYDPNKGGSFAMHLVDIELKPDMLGAIGEGYVPQLRDVEHLLKSDSVEDRRWWLWTFSAFTRVSWSDNEMIKQQLPALMPIPIRSPEYVCLPRPIQRMVHTVLLVAQRLRTQYDPNEGFHLPLEVWHLILEKVNMNPGGWKNTSAVHAWVGTL